ncbi:MULTISPECIES: efflux RND transporter periplasmic adaptor subunit [Betaproteobacteria]|jgi:HlyD family secretion protein|uniref:efflux RND transporter periplasmic adaptor subunit n=1 Tax=Betaproteobacteria TaxID=28216 RepID=UPI001291E5A2|nr:efflux RND transporter periplasmic adaptor subunit [Accumulibacter sp.]HMZ99005.1 efflux RND transporter periplasmic adaptor subunit [Nitrospira sp.]HMW57725.1 efflux RND transporter periplasmic adaptor subunit [Accumulibacter sp.]HNG55423.1 efflux RND transporter periplasmic adaptor subunit [Nitrospira sp.]HNM20061.1 efflux RND transporter periplasmic adaptor subunit [Nitrospira sp.]HNO58904.1 efflux RND transporter periplasmic adaptor subunit [Accumulibacter sp.]
MKPSQFISRKFGLWLFAVVLLLGFGVVVARSGPLSPIQVTTLRVEAGSLSPAIFGIGTVEARRSYLIGPTAAGRVKAVHVDVGETVKAGQLLAEIDPVDLDERLRSTEAAYARAASAVTAAEAQRKDALARRQLAELNAKRYRDLGGKNFVSTSAVEGKQQELDSAQAAVEASEANLQGARQDQLRLKADQEGIRQQRGNLRLLAPRDGLVTSRDAEPGSTVIAGQAALRLVEPDSLWVKARLDQGRSRGLAVGQMADIVLRSNASTHYPGKVARIEPVSDSVTEERIAQIAFERIPEGLSVGEMTEVTVKTGATQSGLLLPNAAIKQMPQGRGVWKLKDGKPRLILVKLGDTGLDGTVQILEGLAAGDEVVIHSERELNEGTRIKVVSQIVGKPK